VTTVEKRSYVKFAKANPGNDHTLKNELIVIFPGIFGSAARIDNAYFFVMDFVRLGYDVLLIPNIWSAEYISLYGNTIAGNTTKESNLTYLNIQKFFEIKNVFQWKKIHTFSYSYGALLSLKVKLLDQKKSRFFNGEMILNNAPFSIKSSLKNMNLYIERLARNHKEEIFSKASEAVSALELCRKLEKKSNGKLFFPLSELNADLVELEKQAENIVINFSFKSKLIMLAKILDKKLGVNYFPTKPLLNRNSKSSARRAASRKKVADFRKKYQDKIKKLTFARTQHLYFSHIQQEKINEINLLEALELVEDPSKINLFITNNDFILTNDSVLAIRRWARSNPLFNIQFNYRRGHSGLVFDTNSTKNVFSPIYQQR